MGGRDQALAPAEINALAKALTGNYPVGIAAREIKGNAGRFSVTFDPLGRPVYNILVDQALPLAAKERVAAHEVGHAIDYFAGRTQGIPQAGIKTELRTVYNDLNNPDLALRRASNPNVDPATNPNLRNYGPEKQGYPASQAGPELNAEAIRAYMADPNYFKTMAPNTAARIREFVNANPELSRIVQFNSIAGLMGLGLSRSEDAPAQ